MPAVNVLETQHRELENKAGQKLSLSALLTEQFEFKDLFVHHEVIPPGRSASSSHSHSTREEMVFVLEGSPVAIEDSQETLLKPGDAFGFQTGSNHFHHLENRSNTTARVLVISSNPPDDTTSYPSSQ